MCGQFNQSETLRLHSTCPNVFMQKSTVILYLLITNAFLQKLEWLVVNVYMAFVMYRDTGWNMGNVHLCRTSKCHLSCWYRFQQLDWTAYLCRRIRLRGGNICSDIRVGGHVLARLSLVYDGDRWNANCSVNLLSCLKCCWSIVWWV